VTADSICRAATRLPRFSVQILRMGCNARILSPVLQIRSPQAFLPGSLDLLTCSPVRRGCRSRRRCHSSARPADRYGGTAHPRRDHDPHFCTFHRILNRAAWPPRAAAGHLLTLLIKAFLPARRSGARQAALQIHRWLLDCHVVPVADSAFAAIEFLGRQPYVDQSCAEHGRASPGQQCTPCREA
jgi:hypothetical protein